MQFRLFYSFFMLALAGAVVVEQEAKTPEAKPTPEQLRKKLYGKRGLQSTDGSDNGADGGTGTGGGDGGDNGGDTGSGAGTGCFSSMNTVEVQGKGIVSMDSIEIGDYVRAGAGANDFSRVFTFAHLDRDIEYDFLQIYSEGAKQPLELTANHMLFVNNKAARADSVQVGDLLDDKKVTNIKNVKNNGLFAPITESGEIVVNGVRSSSYVALMDHVPLNQHYLIHMFFAPQRALCSINFGWCENETYAEDGLSNWSGWATRMYLASNSFSVPVQYLLTAVCALILSTWYTFEKFVVSPLLSIAVIGYIVYKTNTKKVKSA